MEFVRFKRNHFSARLPREYRYTFSHFWLTESEPGLWRIGLTDFATRMLGEIVEFEFEKEAGATLAVADVIGWIEGFKAVSDVYCVAAGDLVEINPAALEDSERICKDSYGEGWLYSVRGTPDTESVDVDGYVEHLTRTIDKMQDKPWKSGEIDPPPGGASG